VTRETFAPNRHFARVFFVVVVMVELRRRPKTPLAVTRPRAEVRAT
jgi:hypothetical protein